MKKLVYSSKQNDPNVVEIDVDVYFDVYQIVDIAATKIKPVLKPDGSMDEEAWSLYDEFITNIYGLINSRFEEISFEPSPYSNTSWYLWFYVKNKDGSANGSKIFRIRISDHGNHYALQNDSSDKGKLELAKIKEKEREYVQKYANEHKRPADKVGDQKYIMKHILINNSKFTDYDDAYLYVDKLLDSIYKKFSK